MSAEQNMTSVWMDQGGTFTDVLRRDDHGRIQVDKVWSYQADQSILSGDASEVRRGTTVATNALIERKGVPTILVTNHGFENILELGDQRRTELFDLSAARVPVVGEGTLGVRGRIAFDGSVLEVASMDLSAARAFVHQGVWSAAVVLIHGPLAAEEEKRIRS